MKQKSLMSMITVMSIFILANGQVIINPALQGIAQCFPEKSYSTILLLATIPNLAVAVVSMLCGSLAGRKISYKALLVIACILFAVFGAIPAFLNSFIMLIVARALFGVGVGIATPLGNAIVLQSYKDEKRATMLGYGSAVMCAAGVAYQSLSGWLTTINLNNMWFVHLVSFIPLLLVVLFLPDMKADAAVTDHSPKGSGFNWRVICMSCAFALIFMFFYPVMLNMSVIVTAEGLGDAGTTGLIQTMYTVGGAVGGILFGKIRKRVNSFMITITLSALALGLSLCAFSSTVLSLSMGTMLCGLGVFMSSSEVLLRIGKTVAPKALSAATGVMMSIWNIGTFASTGYIKIVEGLFGEAPRMPITISLLAVCCILVLWTISDRMKLRQLHS